VYVAKEDTFCDKKLSTKIDIQTIIKNVRKIFTDFQ